MRAFSRALDVRVCTCRYLKGAITKLFLEYQYSLGVVALLASSRSKNLPNALGGVQIYVYILFVASACIFYYIQPGKTSATLTVAAEH